MSPHERRQFAVNVTWTWPMVLALLFFAMLPIWGPIVPPLEGAVAPVTSKITFIQQTQVEGGITARDHRLPMMRIWLLTLASMGFGSAATIVLTKPPVVMGVVGAAMRFISGLLSHAL